MTQTALKKAIKQAVMEVVREERHLLTDALVEAMEQVAFLAAVREGENSKPVTREQVFRALRGRGRSAGPGTRGRERRR